MVIILKLQFQFLRMVFSLHSSTQLLNKDSFYVYLSSLLLSITALS